MRQIKFRIFDKQENEYCEEPDYRWMLSRKGRLYNSENDEWHVLGERYILEFFTGLTDKNGVEIYEGDICQILAGEEYQGYREFDKIGIIKYSGLTFDLVVDNVWQGIYNAPDFNIEVIGNIHQNK